MPEEVPIRLARLVTSCLLFVGTSGEGNARARDLASVPVDYRAPESCPSAEQFSSQVAARTPLFFGGAALSIRVELTEVPEGTHGRVELERDGKVTIRELAAARCSELVEALALVVAILIDPNADTGPVPTPDTAPPPAATPAPAPAPPPPPPRTQESGPASAPARSPSHRRWVLEAGSGAVAESGVAPTLVVGPRFFVGTWFPGGIPSTLDLSVARLWSGRIEDGLGSATMVLDVLRLDACLFEWAEGAFSLEPCAGVEAGVLRVEGTHPAGSSSHSLFWGSAGAELRASASYRDVLRVSAEVGGGVPFVHYRFSFAGQPPLHETPLVGLFLGFGVAVRFP